MTPMTAMTAMTAEVREVRNSIHPTKDELIKTVVVLLDHLTPDKITSEKVLEISGISRGSLYHHFQDFGELLELAQVRRYAAYVDKSIEVMSELFSSVKSRDELIAGLRKVSVSLHAPELANSRMERLTAISKVMNNPRMAAALGSEQERLTQAIGDLFHDLQLRKLGNPALEPRTAAVLFQAYGLGRAVDDFTMSQINQENWLYAISLIVENIFYPEI